MKTPLATLIIVAFLINTIGPLPVIASESFYLPKPGVRVHLSPEFNPPILKGLKVHPDNPFKFDFILDQGDSLPLVGRAREGEQQEQLKQDANRLIKYFLASLTTPEKDLWVNLSPYEKDRIVPESFGKTEMGRDLLAQDYLLKQITASLIYPEDEVGKKFWKRIYEEAEKKFHTTNIPVNTFNKVWIVPEKAVVYENAKAGTAYVVESRLKVMLEQDYLSFKKNTSQQNLSSPNALIGDPNTTNTLASQIVREIVIPELTKEVNENKNFTQLRQVYQSLILATWYKKKIKDSILAQVYADKNKIEGLVIPAKAGIHVEGIYQQYLQAFKKGVFNYIKEQQDPITQETIPRKYFSGGVELGFDKAMNTNMRIAGRTKILEFTSDPRRIDGEFILSDKAMLIQTDIAPSEERIQRERRFYEGTINDDDRADKLMEDLNIPGLSEQETDKIIYRLQDLEHAALRPVFPHIVFRLTKNNFNPTDSSVLIDWINNNINTQEALKILDRDLSPEVNVAIIKKLAPDGNYSNSMERYQAGLQGLSSAKLAGFLSAAYPDDIIAATMQEAGKRTDTDDIFLNLFRSNNIERDVIRSRWTAVTASRSEGFFEAVLNDYLGKRPYGLEEFRKQLLVAQGNKLRSLLVAKLKNVQRDAERNTLLDLLGEMPQPEDMTHFTKDGEIVNRDAVAVIARINDPSARTLLKNNLSRILTVLNYNYNTEFNTSSYANPFLDAVVQALVPIEREAVEELSKFSKEKHDPEVLLRILYMALKFKTPESFQLACDMIKAIDRKHSFNSISLHLTLNVLAGQYATSSQDICRVMENVLLPEQRHLFQTTLVNLKYLELPFSYLEAIYPQIIGQNGPFAATDFVNEDDEAKNSIKRKELDGYTVEVWDHNVGSDQKDFVAQRIAYIVDQAGFKGNERMEDEEIADYLNPDDPKKRIFRDRVILARNSQGEIVGFAFYNLQGSYPYSGFLSYMAVLNEFSQKKIPDRDFKGKGKGVGSILLTKVIQDATQMGRINLNLNAADSTYAVLFYFAYTEKRKGYLFEKSRHSSAPSNLKFPELRKSKSSHLFEFERSKPFIPALDQAIASAKSDLGGIDFNADKINLEVKMDSRQKHSGMTREGDDSEGIKLNIDPAMLEQLRNATGFVPVIINIQPMTDLRQFLGLGNQLQESIT